MAKKIHVGFTSKCALYLWEILISTIVFAVVFWARILKNEYFTIISWGFPHFFLKMTSPPKWKGQRH